MVTKAVVNEHRITIVNGVFTADVRESIVHPNKLSCFSVSHKTCPLTSKIHDIV